jgi:uncharacterized RDD family membrane protein YckC
MPATAHGTALPASGPQLDNRRVLAALIDLVVIAAGAAVLFAAAGVLGGDDAEIGTPLVVVVVCWALYYYFALESGDGQTLGKKVMKLRVVRTDGAPAGMRDITVRTVLRVIDMQLVYLVGLISMLVTGERRGRLGDLAAHTMIVSTESQAQADPKLVPVVTPVTEPETITLPSREPEPPEVDLEPEPAAVEGEPEPELLEVEPEPKPLEVEPEPEPLGVGPELPIVTLEPPAPEDPEIPELRPLKPLEESLPDVDEPGSEDLPPAAEVLPDVMTPSLKELSADVAEAMGSAVPAPEVDESVEEAVPESPADASRR